MKQRIFVLALALGLVCTAGVLYGATGADFDLRILPPENTSLAAGGSVNLEMELKTRIDETQGWSLGVLLDADAGVTAEITALKFGDVIQTLKEGDPAEFQALNFYAATDLATPVAACEPECTGISAGAFNMGVTIQILQQITMPQKPDGIIIAEFTVTASGPEQDPPVQVRAQFSNIVGDPQITTVAVHGGLSFPPDVQEGAVIDLLADPRIKPAQFTCEIEGGEGNTNETVDSTVTLNFNAYNDNDPPGPTPGPVQGWSYGICIQDTAKLAVVDATTEGTDTATMTPENGPPDFNVIMMYPGGVTHAVTCSLDEPLCTIDADNGWEDMIVTYEILMTEDDDSVWVTPCNEGLGTPPVRNVMSVEGQSILMSAFEGTDPLDEVTGCVDPDSCNKPAEFKLVAADYYVPGSANYDGKLDIADAIWILSWLFRDGPEPPCVKAADANNDCQVDSSDAVYIIDYQFRDGSEPVLGTGCQKVGKEVCSDLPCEENKECTP